MDDKINLVLCGAGEVSAANRCESDAVTVFAAEDIDLANCGGDQLNSVLRELASEYVAFADCRREFSLDELQSAPERMAGETAQISLVLSPQLSRFASIWNQLPARVASLIRAPEEFGILIVERLILENTAEFRGVNAPLWDWLIRAVEACRSVLVINDSSAMSADSSIDELDEFPELAPSCPNHEFQWLRSHIENLSASDLGPGRVSATDATALQAGLLLIHDHLDDSHALSQSIEGAGANGAGDYWHAIMHRREPDYSNSKYWFRRVGGHPVFEKLGAIANEILTGCNSPDSATWRQRLQSSEGWDSFAFVDMCQACARTSDQSLVLAARRIQYQEMLLLLEQNWQDALP